MTETICANCGGAVMTGEALCRFCKIKASKPIVVTEAPKIKTVYCGRCGGNHFDNDSLYCVNCTNQPQEERINVSALGLPFHNSETCPNCQSDNTQTFHMAYMQGKNTGNFAGGSYGHRSGFSIMGGKTNSQNLLASSVAPPLHPTPYKTANVLAAIIATASPFLLALFGIKTIIILTLIVAGLYYYASTKAVQMKETYAWRMNSWQRSWICLRCGRAWEQSS